MQFGLNESIICRSMFQFACSRTLGTSEHLYTMSSAVFLLYGTLYVTAVLPYAQPLVQAGVIFASSCCQASFLGEQMAIKLLLPSEYTPDALTDQKEKLGSSRCEHLNSKLKTHLTFKSSNRKKKVSIKPFHCFS